METNNDVLKQCILFKNSSDSDLTTMSRMMTSDNIQEGECLAVKGDKSTSFFILVSGMLLLELEGGKSIVLEKPGDFAGLDILSQKGIYCANLTSLTNGEIISIKHNDFLGLIQNNSESKENIMQVWSRHLSENIPFINVLESEFINVLEPE